MRSVSLLLLAIATTLPQVAHAESSSNAKSAVAAGPSGPYEQAPIRRSGGAATPTTRGSGSAPSAAGAAWDMGKVPIALGGVILLIFGLRWVGKALLPAAAANHRTCRAVQVLVRSTIAPRQQVILIQVGRRLVLVGTAGAQMSPLCEIRQADEVAEVLAQIRSEKRTAADSFKALFGRAERQFDAREAATDEGEAETHGGSRESAAATAETRAELSGLIERVQRMARQFQS
jgi:flagellar biogenesis protein FliO